MWRFCWFGNKEQPDDCHHMAVQGDTEDKARAEAQAQLERNFVADVNDYYLECYQLVGTYFIFD